MPSQLSALLTKPSGSSTTLMAAGSQGGCLCLPRLWPITGKNISLCALKGCIPVLEHIYMVFAPQIESVCDKHNGKQAKDLLLVCRGLNWNCSILLSKEPGLSRIDRSIELDLEAVQWVHAPGQHMWCHVPFHLQSSWILNSLSCCHSTYCRFHLVADLLCIHISPYIANPFRLLQQRVSLSLHQQT